MCRFVISTNLTADNLQNFNWNGLPKWLCLGLCAEGSLVQASSGVPSVVALDKSHCLVQVKFPQFNLQIVYGLNQLVAIKTPQSLC